MALKSRNSATNGNFEAHMYWVQTETMHFYVFDTCNLQPRPVKSYVKTRRSKPVWTIYIKQGKRDAGEEENTMHGRLLPVSIAVMYNSVASLC